MRDVRRRGRGAGGGERASTRSRVTQAPTWVSTIEHAREGDEEEEEEEEEVMVVVVRWARRLMGAGG